MANISSRPGDVIPPPNVEHGAFLRDVDCRLSMFYSSRADYEEVPCQHPDAGSVRDKLRLKTFAHCIAVE